MVIFYLSIFCTGIIWIFADKREIIRRKRVLSDLILMKDIQTELEKEIEQATLKAAFQDGA